MPIVSSPRTLAARRLYRYSPASVYRFLWSAASCSPVAASITPRHPGTLPGARPGSADRLARHAGPEHVAAVVDHLVRAAILDRGDGGRSPVPADALNAQDCEDQADRDQERLHASLNAQ